jgi:hypothetical protein
MEVELYVKHYMKEAAERWGNNEAERMESVIRRIAEAVANVEGIDLKPEDEP